MKEHPGLKEAATLQKVLGPGTGTKLWNFVRGIDERELKAEETRRSISASINVGVVLALLVVYLANRWLRMT